jgi:DMSO reductase anchor subunit
MAIGAFVVDLVLRRIAVAELAESVRPVSAGAALAVGLLALGASVFHLGRPLYAWRAVLGLRHSWMSREVLALSAFAGLATAYAGTLALGAPAPVVEGLGVAVALGGAAAIACSSMLYAVTGKRWWAARRTVPLFALTALTAGSALVLAVAALAAAVRGAGGAALASAAPLLPVLAGATVVKVAGELATLRHLRDRHLTELRRTAVLLSRDFRPLLALRLGAAALGGVLLPLLLFATWRQPDPSLGASLVVMVAVIALVTAGELIERWTFFTAVSSPRMPGGLP